MSFVNCGLTISFSLNIFLHVGNVGSQSRHTLSLNETDFKNSYINIHSMDGTSICFISLPTLDSVSPFKSVYSHSILASVCISMKAIVLYTFLYSSPYTLCFKNFFRLFCPILLVFLLMFNNLCIFSALVLCQTFALILSSPSLLLDLYPN